MQVNLAPTILVIGLVGFAPGLILNRCSRR